MGLAEYLLVVGFIWVLHYLTNASIFIAVYGSDAFYLKGARVIKGNAMHLILVVRSYTVITDEAPIAKASRSALF